MEPTTVAILFVLFMSAVWINYRQGFKAGLENGHTYGVYEVAEYLVEQKAISGEFSDGRKANSKELAVKLLMELHLKREKELAEAE
jgi:hypothetical protein